MAVGFKLQRPADDKGSKLVVGFAFEGVELVRLLVFWYVTACLVINRYLLVTFLRP